MGIRINQLPSASTIDAGGDYFAVTQNGETKKINIETMTQNLLVAKKEYEKEVEKLKQLQDEMINARKHYNNLSERITKENEKVYETINYNDFKNYNGQDIKINRSKIGFTKDMQIEGLTYQNLCPTFNDGWQLTGSSGITLVNNLKINLQSSSNGVYVALLKSKINLKSKTVYTVVANIENNTLTGNFNLIHSYQNIMLTKNPITVTKGYTGIKIGTFTTIDDINVANADRLEINIPVGTSGQVTISNMMILEGDYTQPNSYIPPYFEGIKSVGEKENKISILSDGKNLLKPVIREDIRKIRGVDFTFRKDGTIILNGTATGNGGRTDIFNICPIINFKKNKFYKISFKEIGGSYSKNAPVFCFNRKDNNNIFNSTSVPSTNTITISEDCDTYYGLNVIEGDTYNNYTFKVQLEEGTQATPFEPYKEDKKEILLPFTEGLKGLPNGAKDKIEQKQDGIYMIQRIGKTILNGNESAWIVSSGGLTDRPNTLYFSSNVIDDIIKKQSTVYGMCDRFPNVYLIYSKDVEGFGYVNMNYHLRISILRSKLETPDIEGFKKWLQANPVTVYYELDEPIEYKIENLDSINLKTYNEVTYINSENEIKPNIACKAPSLDEIRKGDN